LRQHIQKLFRSSDVAVAQDVYPAYPFCNVFVAKSLYKFAARESELGHPRSDKSRNSQIGFHLKNPQLHDYIFRKLVNWNKERVKIGQNQTLQLLWSRLRTA